MIPRPGGARLPVKTTTTIKKSTPSGTSISTTTIERTAPAGPPPRSAQSGLRAPKTLYAAPVSKDQKGGCGTECPGGGAPPAAGGLRYGAPPGAGGASRIGAPSGGPARLTAAPGGTTAGASRLGAPAGTGLRYGAGAAAPPSRTAPSAGSGLRYGPAAGGAPAPAAGGGSRISAPSAAPSRLAAPSAAPSRLAAPSAAASRLAAPSAAPSRLAAPAAGSKIGTGLAPPGGSRIGSGLAPPGGSRIGSGLAPPGGSKAASGLAPPSSSRIGTGGASGLRYGAGTGAGATGANKAGGGSLRYESNSSSTTVNIKGNVSTTAMKTSVQPPPPSAAGAIPKTTHTTLSSISTNVGAKKITKSTKKITDEGPPPAPKGLKPGYYYIPFQTQPRSKEGRFMPLSSPDSLRPQMERKKMPNVMILPNASESQCYRSMLRTPGFQDLEAGALFMGGQPQQEYEHDQTPNILDDNLDPEMIQEEWESPQRNIEAEDLDHLEQEIEEKLLETSAKSPKIPLKAVGSRQVMTTSPVIMTDEGPIEATKEIITSQSVIRSPGQPEIIGQHMIGIETVSPGKAIKREIEVQRLSPKYKSPESIQGREVVHVTSSVIVSPGMVQKTKTVTYDRPNIPPSPKKYVPTPTEVAQMIEEEIEDIDKTKTLLVPDLMASRPATYGIRKNVELSQLTRESVSILEQSVVIPSPNPDEEQEEPQPEMIASMMNTEERGLAMGSPPTNVYNYLFSDQKTEAIVEVCSAAPIPMQDVVIPIELPDQTEEFNKGSDVIQAAIDVSKAADGPVKDNLYVESVGNAAIQSKNTARKGKRKRKIPVLTKEIPPWGIQDVEEVQDVVGAPLSVTLQDKPDTEEVEAQPEENGIEYILHMEPPKHSSRVQLRGCQKPSWFPGYMIALPDIPDTVGLAKSPSIVFNAAWRATQPDIFSENSFFIV